MRNGEMDWMGWFRFVVYWVMAHSLGHYFGYRDGVDDATTKCRKAGTAQVERQK